jgi:predicted nucleic acid-binding protein
MADPIVVDASVSLKWVLLEPDSADAVALLTRDLIAPDLWLLECGNALSMHVRAGAMTVAEASRRMAHLRQSPVDLVPTATLSADAFALSIETQATVYDCAYLALAVVRSTVMVTADERFARVAGGISAYQSRVSLLRDFDPSSGVATP